MVGRSVGWLLGWLVGRSVGRSGRRDARGYTRLVKMQTSRFGVDAGRERSRAGRCAIRCCRFACATSKKSDVDCENGKERKRDGKPARERAREGGRKKEAREKSDDGGKATLREKLAASSLCTALQHGWSGLASEMEERKKRESERKRKRAGGKERVSGSRGAFS